MRMPAVFLGHGSPMNALERNRYTEAWRAVRAYVPRPRAILAVSAHWYVRGAAVTAMAKPQTIHDFYGFPRLCMRTSIPRPAIPTLAAERARPAGATRRVGLDQELGHRSRHVVGARARLPEGGHPGRAARDRSHAAGVVSLELGRRLAPLRDEAC